MITLREAQRILTKFMPVGTKIVASTKYGDEYLFLAHGPDPLEGEYDPFIKVDANTGTVSDYSPQEYASPRDLLARLEANAVLRSRQTPFS